MPCTNPVEAWPTPNGMKFSPPKGRSLRLSRPIKIPCRNCIGCKVDRSKEWAVRCMHEASLHKENMFITLTYNDKNLPEDQGLNHEHFKEFMKRYRRYVDYHEEKKISFYMCGEYGEKLGRPHYHALIFGHRFKDLIQYNKDLWISPKLEELWGKGFAPIGNITLNSAAYVARYIMKKMTGDKAENHYKKALVDPETGEITKTFKVQPEYNRMSTRPAIGKNWYDQFKNDVKDQVCHINGKAFPIPKYYLRRLKAENPDAYELVMSERTEYAKANVKDDLALNALKNKYNHQYRNDRSLK